MSGRRTRPAGFFSAMWLLAAKDLKIEWRTWETMAAMLLFSLVVLVVFNFAFELADLAQQGDVGLVPGTIWTVLVFASLIGFNRSFQAELADDTIGALRLSPMSRSAILLGKAGANFVKLLVLQAVLIPLSAVFFRFSWSEAGWGLVAVLVVHTVGLTVLGTLAAAIASRVERGEALVAIVVFPLAAPLLMSAIHCTRTLLEGESLATLGPWLIGALGFDVLFTLVSLLTFEFVLEE